MILENPYHRRKVKLILQENKRLKEEVAKMTTFIAPEEVKFEEIIEEQAEEIKKLKQQIQGYKMQNAKARKQLKELINGRNSANADSGN